MHRTLFQVLAGIILVVWLHCDVNAQQILTNVEVKELFKMAMQTYSVDMRGLDGAVFIRPGSCSGCLSSLKNTLATSTKTKLVVFVCGKNRIELPAITSEKTKVVRDPECATDALSFSKPLSFIVIRNRVDRNYRLYVVDPSTVDKIRSIVR